ncbi:MAG: hypothetical protein INQ03_06875 [Candidatus Heimdallarchaeota archaeon]|nr:hypothetical protein [Candidatus Heimdallarchaeota archaeon]
MPVVLHVKGQDMERVKSKKDRYTFLDGDVYVIDNDDEIFIWRGKDCGVDEQTSGAWVANQLDNTERGGEPKVYSCLQGEEPEELLKIIEFDVVDGDTPGFLRTAKLDMVEYKLFRVFTKQETAQLDEAYVEEVKLDRGSLKSEDVYVLDGNGQLWMWVGEKANREERFEGQKLMQEIDSERNFLPLQYTIYEGEGGKTESAFYEFIEVAKKKGKEVSVEDKRELQYRPEGEEVSVEEKKPWWKFW